MSRVARRFARADVRSVALVLGALIVFMGVAGILSVMFARGNPWFDLSSEVAFRWPLTNTTISFPAVYSGLVLILASVGWASCAAMLPDRGTRILVIILALFFLLMAGDEVGKLHERLESRTGIDWQKLYALPVAVMGLATVLLLLRLRRIDRRAATLLLLGCVAWGVAQYLEFIQWNDDVPMPNYVYLMVPEELLEVSGSAMFFIASISLLKVLVHAHQTAPDVQATETALASSGRAP